MATKEDRAEYISLRLISMATIAPAYLLTLHVFLLKEIDIDSIHSKTSKQGIATITIKFGTQSKEQLRSLVEKIKQVESIIDVERPRG